MPQKMSEHEQQTAVKLARVLSKALPASARAHASGIASGLVRLRREVLDADAVYRILDKYQVGEGALDALVSHGVLERAAGGFRLTVDGIALPSAAEPIDRAAAPATGTVPTAGASAAASGDAASKDIATSSPGTPARSSRAGRSLARLSCMRRQTPELTEMRTRIIELDPRLWINGWLLSTPEAYLRYEPELLALDAAIAGQPAIGDGTCSLRELSYQIFGDEKFLAPESDGRKLLRLMGVSDLLRLRPAFKFDLLSYVPKRHRHLRLVVSENLDPWVNMRNALFLGEKKRLLGERVHGVVFGNGTLARDPAHLQRLIDTMAADDVEVLYWGDIDRAGLEIMAQVAAGAGAGVTVKPFAAAYRLMIERARRRWPDPLDNEPTDQQNVDIVGIELLEPCLDKKDARYLRAVLDAALLIPQEAVLARDL